MRLRSLITLLLLFLAIPAAGETKRFDLATTEKLTPQSVEVTAVRHEGRAAVRLFESPAVAKPDTESIAIVAGSTFENGTIEIDLAGAPSGDASEGARGFVGIAFRVSDDRSRFECIYLRPTNARADDQLRRNHTTQYISHPDYPWYRLRKETPGVYESYADMEIGKWTHMKIVVRGQTARLYVNHSPQPVLVVNDMKHPAAPGSIALWVGPEAYGWFSNLRVTTE